MQAITTTFCGPTDHRGARLSVRCSAKRITVAWKDELDILANHERAALILVGILGWPGHWVGGALPGDTGYCWLDASAYGRDPANVGLAKYAVAPSRYITRNGKDWISICRESATPVEADEATHLIAAFLNLEVK